MINRLKFIFSKSTVGFVITVLLASGVFAASYLVVNGFKYRTFGRLPKLAVVFSPSVVSGVGEGSIIECICYNTLKCVVSGVGEGSIIETSLVLDPLGNRLSFAKLDLNFDKDVLEIIEVQKKEVLTREVRNFDIISANRTGLLTFSVGLEPGMPAPSSHFVFAVIKFRVKRSVSTGGATTVSLGKESEFVNSDAIVMAVSTQPLVINFLPGPTPVISPSPKVDVPKKTELPGSVPISHVAKYGGTSRRGKFDFVRTEQKVRRVPDALYLVSISTKPNREVKGVEGLGLKWNRAGAQCGARSQSRTEVWWAYGSPSNDDYVTVRFNKKDLKSAVVVVNIYAGVYPVNPILNVVSFNTKGVSGSCSRGKDSDFYYYNFVPSGNSMIVSTTSKRHYSHTPLGGFTEIAEIQTSFGGGDDAGVAVMHKFVYGTSKVGIWGSFHHPVDWATVVVELRAF